MRTFSLTTNLCCWFEIKLGLGLALNYVPPRMGYEPFIIGQFLCFMFFVATKADVYGWTWDEETDKPIRIRSKSETGDK